MEEWKANEKLPQSFVHLVNEIIKVNCYQRKKPFNQIASEWGINPATLSRWMAGFGPLNKDDISKLTSVFGRVIQITLGIWPE